MTKKAALPIIDMAISKETGVAQLKTKREGLALIDPLKQEVDLLESISTPGELAVADELFGRIQKARKTWRLKMYGTEAKPGPIPSIRSGLDQLYAINREVDKPLETMENTVEKAMKAYHLAKLKEQQEEQAAKDRAEANKRAELEELERKKAALKLPAAKAKVEQQIIEVESELEEIQEEETPEPQELENSTGRPRKVPTLKSISDVAQGVVQGLIPEDCLIVNMVKVRAYYKEDPAAVALFPGITLEDDIVIVGH